MKTRRGLTIIEIVVAIAILAVVALVAWYEINPAGQFASSRNTERLLHLQTLLNAVKQNIGESATGTFNCASGTLPTSSRRMTSTAGAGNYNIAPCLIPAYLDAMPYDPSASGAHYNSNADYDTAYSIFQNASTSQITVIAPYAELGASVSSTR